MIDAYPLQWPISRKRTDRFYRKADPFKMPSGKIRSDLAYELRRMGADDFVISSNLMVRMDGLPYANQKAPDDPGIALYFKRKGVDICISCDQYNSIDANLRAIGKTVEAIRGIERWGTEEMMDAAFSGFKALPSGSAGQALNNQTELTCWAILGIAENSSKEQIKEAYRRLAHINHPDKGGSALAFSVITKAYNEAMQ
jgi:hypothetical protein